MQNLYKRFSELTTASRRSIATVISAVWGECVLEFPGGGTVTAVGAGTTGTRYFITLNRDGRWRLDGEAPDLPYLEITV